MSNETQNKRQGKVIRTTRKITVFKQPKRVKLAQPLSKSSRTKTSAFNLYAAKCNDESGSSASTKYDLFSCMPGSYLYEELQDFRKHLNNPETWMTKERYYSLTNAERDALTRIMESVSKEGFAWLQRLSLDRLKNMPSKPPITDAAQNKAALKNVAPDNNPSNTQDKTAPSGFAPDMTKPVQGSRLDNEYHNYRALSPTKVGASSHIPSDYLNANTTSKAESSTSNESHGTDAVKRTTLQVSNESTKINVREEEQARLTSDKGDSSTIAIEPREQAIAGGSDTSALFFLPHSEEIISFFDVNNRLNPVEVTPFIRDQLIKLKALQLANGVCECCEKAAPFQKADGQPYLEVHHVRSLADGGKDVISNVVALCPNCHRELHYGARKNELVEQIYITVTRLKRK